MNSNTNSILSLSQRDFNLVKQKDKYSLNIGIKRLVFCLFYSPKCRVCRDFIHLFEGLPSMIAGCTFCVANITNYPEIINMSNQTGNPISVVPTMILYVNGKPYLQYEDDLQIKSI